MCWNADGTTTSYGARMGWPPLETHRWTRWGRKDDLDSWFEHIIMNLAPGLRLHHAACRWAIKRALSRHMRRKQP